MSKGIKIFLIALGILAVAAAVLLGFVLGNLSNKSSENKIKNTPTSVIAQESTTETPSQGTETTNTPSQKTVYVNNADGLNLRKEASLDAEILMLMPYGAELLVKSETTDWYFGNFNDKTGYFKKEFTSTDNPLKDWQVYNDSKYKFTLKIPATWKDYVTREVGANTKDDPIRIEFALPLKAQVTPTTEANVATIFEVVIYKIADWATVKDSEMTNKPSYLSSSSTWAFSYRTISDSVTLKDLEYSQALKDVDSIVDTFMWQE